VPVNHDTYLHREILLYIRKSHTRQPYRRCTQQSREIDR
jgi:hypothetical protein